MNGIGGWFRRLSANMAAATRRFMQGRYGSDKLNTAILVTGLIACFLAMLLPWKIHLALTAVSYGLMAWAIFRMLSRNNEARIKENRKYIELTSGWKTRGNQWVLRMKNRKDYVYFKCPDCKVLLRAKRGGGEKDIVCPRCSTKFKRKT